MQGYDLDKLLNKGQLAVGCKTDSKDGKDGKDGKDDGIFTDSMFAVGLGVDAIR